MGSLNILFSYLVSSAAAITVIYILVCYYAILHSLKVLLDGETKSWNGDEGLLCVVN